MAVTKFIGSVIFYMIIFAILQIYFDLSFVVSLLIVFIFLYLIAVAKTIRAFWINYKLSHQPTYTLEDDNFVNDYAQNWHEYQTLDSKLKKLGFDKQGVLRPSYDSNSIFMYLNPSTQIIGVIAPVKIDANFPIISFGKIISKNHTITVLSTPLPKYFIHPNEQIYIINEKIDLEDLYELIYKKVQDQPSIYSFKELNEIVSIVEANDKLLLNHVIEQGFVQKDVDNANFHRLTFKGLWRMTKTIFPFGLIEAYRNKKRFNNMLNE